MKGMWSDVYHIYIYRIVFDGLDEEGKASDQKQFQVERASLSLYTRA